MGRFKRLPRHPVAVVDGLLDEPLASMRTILQEGRLKKPDEWPDFRKHLWPRFRKRVIDEGNEEWLTDILENVRALAIGSTAVATPEPELPKNPAGFWWMPLPFGCRLLGEREVATSILHPSQTIIRPMICNPYLPEVHRTYWRQFI